MGAAEASTFPAVFVAGGDLFLSRTSQQYFHNLQSLRRKEVFLRMFTLCFLLRATVGFEVAGHFYQDELKKNLMHK